MHDIPVAEHVIVIVGDGYWSEVISLFRVPEDSCSSIETATFDRWLRTKPDEDLSHGLNIFSSLSLRIIGAKNCSISTLKDGLVINLLPALFTQSRCVQKLVLLLLLLQLGSRAVPTTLSKGWHGLRH
jgi:hypothetical protein